jgi:hypothetical protein
MQCDCQLDANFLTVNKDGPNKGRKFYSCKTRKCKFFKWGDSDGYDPSKFKLGTCYRCGNYGCDAVDCEKQSDFYGNLIPENWAELNE